MNAVDENECLTFFVSYQLTSLLPAFLLYSCLKQNISNFYYPQHDQQDDHPQAVEGLGLEPLAVERDGSKKNKYFSRYVFSPLSRTKNMHCFQLFVQKRKGQLKSRKSSPP